MLHRITTLSLLALSLPAVAAADEPLPPPAVTVTTSASGSIRAVSDPRTKSTRVERAASGKLLWSVPGWQRWLFVPEDGKHLVTTGVMNLIPVDHDADLVLFTFWREGRKVRDVPLKEVVPDEAVLQRTVSHFHWGTIDGFDPKGRLLVRRADGTLFRYDLATGRPAR